MELGKTIDSKFGLNSLRSLYISTRIFGLGHAMMDTMSCYIGSFVTDPIIFSCYP